MKRTVRELYEQARRVLRKADVDSAEWDARALLREALHLSEVDLLTRQAEVVPEPVAEQALALVARRVEREPLAYILGHTEFYGLRFACDGRALVPRPETEGLVDAARQSCERLDPGMAVVDVGTGTGVLAVTLAVLYPELTVWATDTSAQALHLAASNAAYHHVSARLRLAQGSGVQPLLTEGLRDRIAVVVSNPPYVRSAELEHLQPEITRYEPRMALDGGAEGLDVYRMLLAACVGLPKLEAIHLEIGADQAQAVTALSRTYLPRASVEVARDLAGLPRIVSLLLPMQETPAGAEQLVAGGV
jgi:release factor glutamine methyltransferase